MKPIKMLLVSTIILLFAFVQDGTFKQLHVLQGSWTMQTKRGNMGETWKVVNANHLQSRAYSVKAGDTSVYENVALENKKDGIFYTVTSTNQNDNKPVPFKLTSSTNSKFVFENLEHDFPKRIVYELVNKDSIHAFIDNGEGIKTNHFFFSRAKQ